MEFWIERGVDGFRLDAVPFLFESEGTRCEGLPETHRFLKMVRERVDSHERDILLLAEAIQPVNEAASYLGEDELHGAFNFVLTAHLFAAVASGDSKKLRHCLQESQEAVSGCRWALPLRNHDELWLGDGHLIPAEVVQTIRAGLHQGHGDRRCSGLRSPAGWSRDSMEMGVNVMPGVDGPRQAVSTWQM